MLRAINGAGQIAIVPVGPTRGLLPERGLSCEVVDDGAGHIKDNVVRTAGEPHHCIVLRGRHHKPFRPSDLAVEPRYSRRGVIGSDPVPKLRPKANNEVHATCCGPWLTNRCDRGGKLRGSLRVHEVELEVRMGGGPKSEDSSLGRVHARILSARSRHDGVVADRSPTGAGPRTRYSVRQPAQACGAVRRVF